MEKEKVMRAVAANVAMHPHSAELYTQLFLDAHQLKRPIHLRGDRYALFASITRNATVHQFEHPVVKGVIATFLHLDANAPWFNLETLDEADADLTRAVRIPPQLRASMARYDFVFDPVSHVIVAEAEAEVTGDETKIVRLSAGQLASFLGRLFEDERLFDRYGSVAVTAIPDPRSVEAILASQGLRRLTIIIKPPNPDDVESLSHEISARLRAQGAGAFRQELTAKRNEVLDPDAETRNLARVGALNGRVEATIANPTGGTKSVSTAKKPAQFDTTYYPDEEGASRAFERVVARAVEDVTMARDHVEQEPEPDQPPPRSEPGMT